MMEPWLAHTKKHIPELEKYCQLSDIDSPMALWIELDYLFLQAAYDKNEELIQRIFKEATYYVNYEKNPKGDVYSTAVALAFIEHFLNEIEKIPYVIKFYPKANFIAAKALLTYHNTEKRYQSVLKQYNTIS